MDASNLKQETVSHSSPLIIFLKAIGVFGIVIRYALATVIFIYAVGYGLSFFNGLDSNFFAKPFIFYDLILSAYPASLIPSINGHDLSRVILGIVTYIVRGIVGLIAWRILNLSEYLTVKQTIDESHVDLAQLGKIADYSRLEEKMNALKFSGAKDGTERREELLKILKEAQQGLDSMKRNLSFLAVDVVDSTGMKVGENPTVVELDFAEYKNLVENAFKENGYLKASWTPDGVMACFGSAASAVKAAFDILQHLKDFNKTQKSMRRDFAVRCGINSGKVSYDENLPAEKMCDRVIDIAGHFQKYAPPGRVCISKRVYEDMYDTDKFRLSDQKIDGLEAYVSR